MQVGVTNGLLPLEISLPFTCEFDITRNTYSSSNVASFRLYNLNPNTRYQIRKDPNNPNDLRFLSFNAGYVGSNLALAFSGSIKQAWSVREGVNFITEIQCFDGGFAFINATTESTFPAGTPNQAIATSLVNDLTIKGTSDVSLGAIGRLPIYNSSGGSSSYMDYLTLSPTVLSGNTADNLRQYFGGNFYVDCGLAYILGDSEAIKGQVPTINAMTGLLGTPIREQYLLNFDMLFEPQLLIGQQVFLQSSTADTFSGNYKVIGLKHKGIISPVICGKAITTVNLDYGKSAFNIISTSQVAA